MTDSTKQTAGGWGSYVSPLIDCLTLAAYVYFLPWLAHSYLTVSLVNGLIIGSSFVMLLVSITALKELAFSKRKRKEGTFGPVTVSRKRPPAKKKQKKESSSCFSPELMTMACSFLYCGYLALVFLSTATTYDLNSDAGNTAGAWLMLGGALIILLAIVLPSFGETKANSPTETLLHALSVLGIAFATIVGMAFWESMKLADPGGAPEEFHGIWKLIIFLILVLVFAMFFGMPRIYLHIVKSDRWGLITYVASLGYYVWDLFEF